MSKGIPPPIILSFILSWNLRNLPDIHSKVIPETFNITGVNFGRFPIDAWKTYFLETPKYGVKKDIVGRTIQAFGIKMKNTAWNRDRIVMIPVYTNNRYSNIKNLKSIIKHWDAAFISDDIPCFALAVKSIGYYSDDREAQSVTVLLIWNDATSRVITLDWAEGPVEDCITPEWYVEATSLLNLDNAFRKIQKTYEKNPSWDGISFSIYLIPPCLGCNLAGKKCDTSYDLWKCEWKYNDHGELREELDLIFSEIWSTIFEKTRVGIQ